MENNMREKRREKGVTLRWMEGQTGIHESTLSRIERAEVVPTIYRAYRIACVLDAKVQDVFPNGCGRGDDAR